MFAPLLLALIGPAAPAVTPPTPVPQQSLRIWLNRQGTFYRGDKVRVYTRAADDGYLFVLHVEPNGRVRVLFPLDPMDDNFLRAGQDYEIRGRGDRDAIQMYEASGAGTVFAALSADPFRFDPLVLNAHWDYRAADWNMTGDPETDLTALAERLTGGGRFDYDIQRYVVGAQVAYDGGGWYEPSFYDPYYSGHNWYGGTGFSIRVGLGHRYGRSWYDPWYWDPYWSPWWAWDPWWYSSPCWGGCYWPRVPVYYADPYYYGPTRYVYATNGDVNRRYTFKSSDDRYGLSPNAIGARRRTLASGAGQTASPGRTSVAPTGRRTTTGAVGSTGSTSPTTRATPGRRPSATGSTTPGTRSPEPRATPGRRGTSSPPASAAPARPPASRPSGTPTRRQSSQTDQATDRSPAVGEPLDDGSYRLPSPTRRSSELTPTVEREPVGTLERRSATPPPGLRPTNDAPAPQRVTGSPSSQSTGRTSMPTSIRQTEPRPVSPNRDAPSASSSGRRSPSASPAPSSRAPSTRPAPSRPSYDRPSRSAAPAPRSSPPSRGAPSRPSSGGSSRSGGSRRN